MRAEEVGICISPWDLHWGGRNFKTSAEVGRQRAFLKAGLVRTHTEAGRPETLE